MGREEVDAELLLLGFDVQSGLEVRDVQCVGDGLNVGAQQGIEGPEHCLHSEGNLLAGCGEKKGDFER